MSGPGHRGFTLVELLVVIVVIGVLIGLMVPAVNSARESARRTQCMDQQKNLAQAIQQYERDKGHFPGYLNQAYTNPKTGNKGTPVSWLVVLFDYLDRKDLWEQWRYGDGPKVQFGGVLCPNDPQTADAAEPTSPSYVGLSYVVNASLFRDLSTPDPKKNVSMSQVESTRSTVMLSERLASGPWAGPWTPDAKTQLTFVWNDDPPSKPDAWLWQFLSPNPTVAAPLHRGGWVVTFCDGHGDFLSGDTLYNEFSGAQYIK